MIPKYRAIWIPSGEDLLPGTICINDLGDPYRFTHFDGGFAYFGESAGKNYIIGQKGCTIDFRPAKLYLCDKNKHVGGRIYNPKTRECFVCPNEFYISDTNNYYDDYNVVAAIDPNCILNAFTPIEEDNIEGYMFGGGEDQLGYVILTGIADKYYAKLP